MSPLSSGSSDEIVHVPVPKHLLPAVYEALANAMSSERRGKEHTVETTPVLERPSGSQNMIDLAVKAARDLGAQDRPVVLRDLHSAYLRANPGIGKGVTANSFSATVNYHCINMRSRFPNLKDRRQHAYWLSHPLFKRTGHAQYMLLSADEVARFNRAVDEGNPLIYTDQYDVAELA